jgi:hypothetical protein
MDRARLVKNNPIFDNISSSKGARAGTSIFTAPRMQQSAGHSVMGVLDNPNKANLAGEEKKVYEAITNGSYIPEQISEDTGLTLARTKTIMEQLSARKFLALGRDWDSGAVKANDGKYISKAYYEALPFYWQEKIRGFGMENFNKLITGTADPEIKAISDEVDALETRIDPLHFRPDIKGALAEWNSTVMYGLKENPTSEEKGKELEAYMKLIDTMGKDYALQYWNQRHNKEAAPQVQERRTGGGSSGGTTLTNTDVAASSRASDAARLGFMLGTGKNPDGSPVGGGLTAQYAGMSGMSGMISAMSTPGGEGYGEAWAGFGGGEGGGGDIYKQSEEFKAWSSIGFIPSTPEEAEEYKIISVKDPYGAQQYAALVNTGKVWKYGDRDLIPYYSQYKDNPELQGNYIDRLRDELFNHPDVANNPSGVRGNILREIADNRYPDAASRAKMSKEEMNTTMGKIFSNINDPGTFSARILGKLRAGQGRVQESVRNGEFSRNYAAGGYGSGNTLRPDGHGGYATTPQTYSGFTPMRTMTGGLRVQNTGNDAYWQSFARGYDEMNAAYPQNWDSYFNTKRWLYE